MYSFLAVIIPIAIIMLFSVIGVIFRSFFCMIAKTKADFSDSSESLILPLIGAGITVCATQTLNIVLPARAIAVIYTPLIIYGIVKFRKEIFGFFRTFLKNRVVLGAAFVSVILAVLPCIGYNSFLTLHFANNDAAYYFSSIEWLRDNSVVQAFSSGIYFSDTHPFDSLADYIIKTTRIGTDILIALIISYLPLRAYQVYLLMCAVFCALCVFAASYASEHVFGMSKTACRLLSVLLGTGTGVVELIKQQYMPQIFGISFFVFFICCVYKFFFAEDNKAWNTVMLSLSLISLVSVYSEYASYAFVVFAISFFIKTVLRRNIKVIFADLVRAFKMLGVAIILNLPGFIIALKFNINIIISSLSDLSAIDPYGGCIADLSTVVKYFSNVDIPAFGQSYQISGKIIPTLFVNLCWIIVLATALTVAALIVKAVISDHGEKSLFLGGCVLFFVAYWGFFRMTRYAYGEYKHVHLTITAIFIAIFYFVDTALKTNLIKKPVMALSLTKTVLARFICVIVVCVSVCNTFGFSQISKSPYRFDDSMDELAEAVEQYVPAGECVGVLNNLYFQAHATVYALSDTDYEVSLMNNISYFTYFVNPRTEYPDYYVLPISQIGTYGELLSKEDYTLLWKNSSYVILKSNQKVKAFKVSGFSDLYDTAKPQMFCNIGKEASFVIANTDSVERLVTVGIESGVIGDIGCGFKVYIGDRLIGSGVSGETFRSEPFTVRPSEEPILKIVTNGDIDTQSAMKVYTLDVDIVI